MLCTMQGANIVFSSAEAPVELQRSHFCVVVVVVVLVVSVTCSLVNIGC